MNRFCSNCGRPIAPENKFCPECGMPTCADISSALTPNSVTTNNGMRQQEFVGKILKCPNCGAIINQSTAICPDCGYQITERTAVSSVKFFNEQLMDLESNRKNGIAQMIGFGNPVDTQKISLIQTFPIPNTIDDIQEFILLAMANIDVSLSKSTLGNNFQRVLKGAMNANLTAPRAVSDAWVSKMIQAYQKAAIMFPNEPAFAYIKQLYTNKMKELKMKVD